jgi:hypothetical protein
MYTLKKPQFQGLGRSFVNFAFYLNYTFAFYLNYNISFLRSEVSNLLIYLKLDPIKIYLRLDSHRILRVSAGILYALSGGQIHRCQLFLPYLR